MPSRLPSSRPLPAAAAARSPAESPAKLMQARTAFIGKSAGGDPAKALKLAQSFATAFERSVAKDAPATLTPAEKDFLTLLPSVAGQRDKGKMIEIVNALRDVQTAQKAKLGRSDLDTYLAKMDVSLGAMASYESNLMAGREDAQAGRNTAAAGWLKGSNTSNARQRAPDFVDHMTDESAYQHGVRGGGYSVYNPTGSGAALVAGPGQQVVKNSDGSFQVVRRPK